MTARCVCPTCVVRSLRRACRHLRERPEVAEQVLERLIQDIIVPPSRGCGSGPADPQLETRRAQQELVELRGQVLAWKHDCGVITRLVLRTLDANAAERAEIAARFRPRLEQSVAELEEARR
jgi:hypothetical protein